MNSSVIGGVGNAATGNYSAVVGGGSNTTEGDHAAILGGHNNHAPANYSTIAGGSTNRTEGDYSSIGGGVRNKTTGRFASISGGENNEAHGEYSSVGGGESRIAQYDHSSLTGRLLKRFSSSEVMAPNYSMSLRADCPMGWTVIDGGWEHEINIGGGRHHPVHAYYDEQVIINGRQGWEVGVRNDSGDWVILRVYALCECEDGDNCQ